MCIEDGYFCRESHLPEMSFAFTNYGVSIGLQAADAMLERVERLNAYVEQYRSGDEYYRAAITHVMACNSHFPGPWSEQGRRLQGRPRRRFLVLRRGAPPLRLPCGR